MAVGRRFGSSVLLLVTLASLVGLISGSWQSEIRDLIGRLAQIRQRMGLFGSAEGVQGLGQLLYQEVRMVDSAGLFRQMVEGQCVYNKHTHAMIASLEDEYDPHSFLRILAIYAADMNLVRCADFYHRTLKSAVENSSGGGVLDLLHDEFFGDFYHYNQNFPQWLLFAGQPGSLLGAANRVLADFGWTATRVSDESADCMAYETASRPIMGFFRALVALTQNSEFGHYTVEFRQNVFRYTFCEDIRRCKELGILEVVLPNLQD